MGIGKHNATMFAVVINDEEYG